MRALIILLRKLLVFLKAFLRGRNGRYSSSRLVVITFGPTMGASFISSLIYFMVAKDSPSILNLISTGFIFLGSAMGIIAAFKETHDKNIKADSDNN